ncbi:MAG: hypothetical protein ACKO61_07895, partial [Actinomycetota bacterium]
EDHSSSGTQFDQIATKSHAMAGAPQCLMDSEMHSSIPVITVCSYNRGVIRSTKTRGLHKRKIVLCGKHRCRVSPDPKGVPPRYFVKFGLVLTLILEQETESGKELLGLCSKIFPTLVAITK